MATACLSDWIALNLLPGVGPRLARRAVEFFGDAATVAYRVDPQELGAVVRSGKLAARTIEDARRTLRRDAERELRRCRRHGILAIPYQDPAFPRLLLEIPDPPILLYQRGEIPDDRLRVAVIGSRSPTSDGRHLATGLGGGLAARGIEVVSGGARGIDGLAHRAALAAEGRTIAVLGSGLLEPYPREHARLFEEIAEKGAVLTEFPLDTPPLGGHFPRRNRLISGLSAAVVVVEAAERSGTLNTAAHALEQGREVMAVPGRVFSERSVGCHRLIQEGAKLVQNIDDIFAELPPEYLRGVLPAAGLPEAPGLEGLSEDEALIMKVLDANGPVHLDELAESALIGIARLQSALLGLELRGAVEQSAGRYYLLRPRREL